MPNAGEADPREPRATTGREIRLTSMATCAG